MKWIKVNRNCKPAVFRSDSNRLRRLLLLVALMSCLAAAFACGSAESKKMRHSQKATILEGRGRYDEAIQELQKALAIDPNFGAAYYEIGRCYAKLKSYNSAIEALETAKKFDSNLTAKTAQQIGIIYEATGQHSLAENVCLTALSAVPNDIDLMIFLAKLKWKEKDGDKTRFWLERALTLDPDSSEALMFLAQIDIREREYAAAEQRLKKILSGSDSKNMDARLALAGVYRITGRMEDAVKLLESAVTDRPDFGPARAALAEAYFSLNRLEEARKQAEAFLQASPRSSYARLLLGTISLKQHDYDTALVHLTHLSNSPGTSPDVYYKLGLALRETGEFAQAVQALQKALALQPDNSTYRLILAETLLENGSFENAQRELEAILSNDPANEQAQKLLRYESAIRQAYDHIRSSLLAKDMPPTDADSLVKALKLFQADDLESTKNLCEGVLKNSPKSALALNLLGLTYLKKTDVQQALSYFQRASSADPGFAASYVNMANVYMSMGSDRQAIEIFQKAVATAPKDMTVRMKFAQALVLMKRYAGAESVLRNLIKDNPGQIAYRTTLANLYMEMNRYADAREQLSEILQLAPQNTDIQSLHAETVAREGNLVAATEEFEKLGESDNTSSFCRPRLALCLLASGKDARAKEIISTSSDSESNSLSDLMKALIMFREKNYRDAEGILASLSAQEQNEPLYRLMLLNTRALLQTDTAAAEDISNSTGSDALFRSYEKMLKGNILDPNELYEITLGMALARAQWRLLAVSRLEHVLAAGCSEPSLLDLVAGLYEKEALPDKAASCYRSAIASDPSYWPAHYKLGIQHLTRGQASEAEKCFGAALQYQPDAPTVLSALARAYEMTGDEAAALGVYQKIIALDPDRTSIMNNLAWLLARNPRKLNEAMEFAQKAEKDSPLKPEVQDTLGWVYFQKKDYEKAMQHLEKAVTYDPLNPSIRYHRGMSYYMLGKNQQALQDFQAAGSKDIAFPEKKDNTDMIARLSKK